MPRSKIARCSERGTNTTKLEQSHSLTQCCNYVSRLAWGEASSVVLWSFNTARVLRRICLSDSASGKPSSTLRNASKPDLYDFVNFRFRDSAPELEFLVVEAPFQISDSLFSTLQHRFPSVQIRFCMIELFECGRLEVSHNTNPKRRNILHFGFSLSMFGEEVFQS